MPSQTAKHKIKRLDNLLIRASAGTGKTYQLAHRYLALLYRGVPPERILATTFTRKAAAEILDRIVTRLAAAALDESQRNELGRTIGATRFTRQECLAMLRLLLRNLHRLRISTLDSLFGQIARAFSLEMGLPPGWRIVDDAEEVAVRDLAIDAVLRREETGKLLALTHLLTKGEASRGVGELIRGTVATLHALYQEAPLEAWYAITRHQQLDPVEFALLLEETRQLSLDKRAQTARDGDYQRALVGDWEGFLKQGLAAKVLMGEASYYSKPISEQAVDVYQRLLKQARAVLMNRVALQTEGSHALLQSFDEERQRWQQEHRGLRFDDITHALGNALGEKVSSIDADSRNLPLTADDRALAHRLDGSVSHLLLDEFQDTSPRQWRALRPFVGRATQGDEHSSFFCVGDVKQAIYGWRGGVAEIFDAIEQQVSGLRPQPLTHSFRSSQAVIDLVNRVFQKACQHPRLDRCEPAVKTWCDRFQEHSTEKSQWVGYACLRTAAAASDEQSPQQNVLQSAADLISDLYHQTPDREIGVLVRTNETVGRLIHLLRQRKVPASEEGGNPLTDSAAVQIVLSLLRLTDHPGDTVAQFHVATSPLGSALGWTDHRDAEGARRLAGQIRGDLQVLGFGQVVQRLAAVLREHCHWRDRSRLEQLVERAYSYQPRMTIRADDFVRQIEWERVAEPSRAPIRVMTIHQSKGLEFDTVVLPELDVDLMGQPPPFVVERLDPVAPVSCVCRYVNVQLQRLLQPRIQKMFEAATDREVSVSLCVLYVALIRAIHALHIVIPPSKTNESSFPRTLAGIVRSALCGTDLVPPETVLFALGNPNWNRELPAAHEQVLAEAEAAAVVVTRVNLAPSDGRRRGLERIRPSGLEGGSHVRLQRWLDADRRASALRGTILHACFQQVAWIEDGIPDDDSLLNLIADVMRHEGHAGNAMEWLSEFRRALEYPVIESQLCRRAYREPEQLGFSLAVARQIRASDVELVVENERPFAIGDAGGILSGSIDRLVILRDKNRLVAADILDYKTDTLPADNDVAVGERLKFYRPQLAAYRRAVSKMTGLPSSSIAARLLFVFTGRAIVVTEDDP